MKNRRNIKPKKQMLRIIEKLFSKLANKKEEYPVKYYKVGQSYKKVKIIK